ncbi:MAG: hypothetical protein P3B98_00115 [Gemmatimonadota bacterium]|nr:hypothetical protein [Gemmatimonadota bacterium]
MLAEFPVEYEIDAQDRLARVNTGWYDEARTSFDARLQDPRLIGRGLWDLIRESTTQQLYEPLIARVRRHAVRVDFAFRCDTPDERRLLRMRVVPKPNHHVAFQVRLLQSQFREPVELLRIDRASSDSFIRMCGWCKRLPIAGGFWVEVEEALQSFGLFDADALPAISHGICPECREKVTRGLLDDEWGVDNVICGVLPAA